MAPADQGRRLYELAPPPKTLYVIPGAGHNDTYATGGEAYWREWERFFLQRRKRATPIKRQQRGDWAATALRLAAY